MIASRFSSLPTAVLTILALSLFLGCSAAELDQGCHVAQASVSLPPGLEESSGVAVSRDHRGVIWTHNDSGGDAEVVAVRADGGPFARVEVRGALAKDWEDLALAPCPAGTCLYVADTGDGEARRQEIGVYRFPEPDPVRQRAVTAEYFPARYPAGARDAEALFVLPSGEIFLVTKGRVGSIEVYRYPLPLSPGETVTLEPVRTLAAGAQPLDQQVTGASASPSGERVAIRTYKRLELWRTAELLGDGAPYLTVDLTPLGEAQGEAVALLDNGALVLTSEGGFPGARGSMAVVECPLEE